MVTPYMEHDLSGLLENPRVHLTLGHIKCYMKQLFEGLCYLHSNHLIHRDIKGNYHSNIIYRFHFINLILAANLLIDNDGILKIADFGLARRLDPTQPRDYTNCVVTRWYRPPELLLGEKKYDSSVDIWGAG
jgi:serine/threonine-protein kinase BUR1